jgi:hypothetical protein
MNTTKVDIKVQSQAGRLFVEAKDIIESVKGQELINKAKNSSIFKEIIQRNNTREKKS